MSPNIEIFVDIVLSNKNDRTAERLRYLMINYKHVITLIHKKIKLCFSTKITGYHIHHYAILNNISVISLGLVLLMEET